MHSLHSSPSSKSMQSDPAQLIQNLLGGPTVLQGWLLCDGLTCGYISWRNQALSRQMCIFQFQNPPHKELDYGEYLEEAPTLLCWGEWHSTKDLLDLRERSHQALLNQGRRKILPWCRRTRQKWQGPAAALCARTACTQPQWCVRQHPELPSCSQVGEKRAGRNPCVAWASRGLALGKDPGHTSNCQQQLHHTATLKPCRLRSDARAGKGIETWGLSIVWLWKCLELCNVVIFCCCCWAAPLGQALLCVGSWKSSRTV